MTKKNRARHCPSNPCKFCEKCPSIKKSWFGLGKWKLTHTCRQTPKLQVLGRGFSTEDEAVKEWNIWNERTKGELPPLIEVLAS